MAKQRKYTKELLSEAVEQSESVAGVLRYLGLKQAGGTQAHISRRIKEYELDTSHFTGQAWNRGKTDPKRKPWNEILVLRVNSDRREHSHRLRRALVEMGRPYMCEECRIGDTWRDKPITLQVEHSNGDWLDCRPENLRFLCPNCHSQTPTWCKKK